MNPTLVDGAAKVLIIHACGGHQPNPLRANSYIQPPLSQCESQNLKDKSVCVSVSVRANVNK